MTTSESQTAGPPETRSGPDASADGALLANPAVLAPAGLLLVVGGAVSYYAMLTVPGVRTTAWPTFAMIAIAVALGAAAVVRRRRWWTVSLAVANLLVAGVFTSFFFLTRWGLRDKALALS